MPIRILIIDDSATNRLLFSLTVNRMGHIADVAASGAEAEILFKNNRYDLVFIDLNMPGKSGIDTARALSAKNPNFTPLYAISGFPDPRHEHLIPEAGLIECLIKPLDRDKLQSIISHHGLHAAEPAPESDQVGPVPQRLIDTYARELRSRARACSRYLEERNIHALSREAHTLHSLGQILHTADIESAAAKLESLCILPLPENLPQEVENLSAACHAAASRIEKLPRGVNG